MKEQGFGRVRVRRIPDVRRTTLEAFVQAMVEPGSIVRTDAWTGYARLDALGYAHEVVNQSKSEDPAHVVMPGVHRVASLLKRLVIGTYHGGISREHLDFYLDEYTFRFNRRASTSRGLLFYRLLEGAVQTGPTPTRALFGGRPAGT
jgi:transposase-like protein